jgi:hypothetical protein
MRHCDYEETVIRFLPSNMTIRPVIVLAGVLAGIVSLLLIYSQTIAFAWDAGFHLLAAQMINSGKRPYIDFCFPQTVLNTWWMAIWMRLLGQSWRVAQALAALALSGAIVLASTYVFRRLPIARWRLAAAVVTAVLFGFHELVFRFGTIAQAYAICMFLTVAAFRVAIGTPDRAGPWRPAAAGCLAGAAAGCSLLSAAAIPVFLAWIAFANRKGKRWVKCAVFATAAAVPFTPMARLFVEGPSQTWFNIFQYQFAFRHAVWGNTVAHDLGEISTWLNSTQSLSLFLLAAAAWWFVRGPECPAALRSELYLCGCLALALQVEVALARPTFARYFVLAAPFLAIMAGPGFYEVATRLRGLQSGSLVPALLVVVLMVIGAVHAVYDNSDVYRWRDLERVAAKIRQVAPPNPLIYAEEPVYFLLHVDPPEGMQFAYSRELDLPPAQSAQLHIVPQEVMDQRVQAGAFDVAEVCLDQGTIDRLKLKSLYRQTERIEYCDIFWDRTVSGLTPGR